jgi:acyl-coenzyme A thioesterase 9
MLCAIPCSVTIASDASLRPVNVNPLIVSTPEEKRLYALGERNSKVRKQRKETALIKHTPNDLESDLIHAFWQKQLQYRTYICVARSALDFGLLLARPPI